MKNNYLAKQKRQFKGLCKKISKNWDAISTQERETLLSRFRRLYVNLKSAFARPALKKMMGAAAVVLMSMGGVQAQQFAAPVQNPFGLAENEPGGRPTPTFIDIDGDGDMDMFSGASSGKIYFFENTGTASNPSFAAAAVDTFGLLDIGSSSAPTFADVDNDGLINLFIGRNSGSYVILEDTSASGNNTYLSTDISIALGSVPGSSKPAFVDIDGDGDLDVFSGSTYGNFFFYENSGTANAPNISNFVQDTFGLLDISASNDVTAPTFIDIDGDGDMDMFAGGFSGSFYFFRNTGSSSAPSFASFVADTFGLSSVPYGFSAPAFVDIDGDGDMDMFSGNEYGNYYYFENTSSGATAITLTQPVAVQIYPNPVSEELTIELSTSANYQIRITDLTGREIHSEFVQNDNNLQLSTQAWPAGLYLLQVRDEEGRMETKKIVKR